MVSILDVLGTIGIVSGRRFQRAHFRSPKTMILYDSEFSISPPSLAVVQKRKARIVSEDEYNEEEEQEEEEEAEQEEEEEDDNNKVRHLSPVK